MKKKPEVFFRVRQMGKLNEADQWDVYQIEVAKLEDGKWKKTMYDKPDIKQMILGKLETLILDSEGMDIL